jgi:hypothetical protein
MVDETGKEVEFKDGSMKLLCDNTPPAVTIKPDKELMQKSGKNLANIDVKYTVAATDNDSGVAGIFVRLDEKGDFVPYTKEIVFTSNGDHVIEAKAVDKVGNVSPVVVYSVIVDSIPPETKIEAVIE